jgi:hypothetical protein
MLRTQHDKTIEISVDIVAKWHCRAKEYNVGGTNMFIGNE